MPSVDYLNYILIFLLGGVFGGLIAWLAARSRISVKA
jgi:hypothetical protein